VSPLFVVAIVVGLLALMVGSPALLRWYRRWQLRSSYATDPLVGIPGMFQTISSVELTAHGRAQRRQEAERSIAAIAEIRATGRCPHCPGHLVGCDCGIAIWCPRCAFGITGPHRSSCDQQHKPLMQSGFRLDSNAQFLTPAAYSTGTAPAGGEPLPGMVAGLAMLALVLVGGPAFAGQLSPAIGRGAGDGGLGINAAAAPYQLSTAPNGDVIVAQGEVIRRLGMDGKINRISGAYYRLPAGNPPIAGPATLPLNSVISAVTLDGMEFFASSENAVYVTDVVTRRPFLTGLRSPMGLFAHDDELLIADFENDRILACDIPAVTCTSPRVVWSVPRPVSIYRTADGTLYVFQIGPESGTWAGRIKARAPNGTVRLVAGGGAALGDGGPATQAKLSNSGGQIVVAPTGVIYVGDTAQHRVRRIDPATGIITTIAGTGISQSAGGAWTPCGEGCDSNAQPITNPLGLAWSGGRLAIGSASDQLVYWYVDAAAPPPTATRTSPPATATATSPPATLTSTRTPVNTATPTRVPPTVTATASPKPTCDLGECRVPQ
jgi:hypothetical protein